MSRTGLHRPRLTRAAPQRPAHDTRLLFTLFPPHILHPNTHYKRCPKAQRLVLRSDQSPSRPSHGMSPDKSRQTLFKGNCQVSAPLIGRNGFAPSGDAQEHGVKLLHRATEPFSDSTVVTIGMFRSMNAGHGSPLPSLRMVEHFRWARLPQSESFSRLVHTLSEVWGKDSTVVTTGELPTTNGGHGSPLPSLRVVEHFRWARLPQSENFSRLVHTLSEVWGCRRFDAGVDRPQGRTPRIGTGVADFLHKPSGTFHPLPSFFVILALPTVIPAEAEPAPEKSWGIHPSETITYNPATHSIPSPLPSSSVEAGTRPALPGVGWGVAPSPLPSTELEAEVGAKAPTSASVLLSPYPLMTLREIGIKGVRVFPQSLKQSKSCLKSQNNQKPTPSPCPLRHANSPEIPSGVVQSKQLRVQSNFNQRSIKKPPPQIKKNPRPVIPPDRNGNLCKLPPHP